MLAVSLSLPEEEEEDDDDDESDDDELDIFAGLSLRLAAIHRFQPELAPSCSGQGAGVRGAWRATRARWRCAARRSWTRPTSAAGAARLAPVRCRELSGRPPRRAERVGVGASRAPVIMMPDS